MADFLFWWTEPMMVTGLAAPLGTPFYAHQILKVCANIPQTAWVRTTGRSSRRALAQFGLPNQSMWDPWEHSTWHRYTVVALKLYVWSIFHDWFNDTYTSRLLRFVFLWPTLRGRSFLHRSFFCLEQGRQLLKDVLEFTYFSLQVHACFHNNQPSHEDFHIVWQMSFHSLFRADHIGSH